MLVEKERVDMKCEYIRGVCREGVRVERERERERERESRKRESRERES